MYLHRFIRKHVVYMLAIDKMSYTYKLVCSYWYAGDKQMCAAGECRFTLVLIDKKSCSLFALIFERAALSCFGT